MSLTILGSVDRSTTFLFTSIISRKPYVLVYDNSRYRWSEIDENLTGSISVFTVYGTIDDMSIYDMPNSTFLNIDANGYLSTSTQEIKFSMSQTQYNNWDPPSVFLVGPTYTITFGTTIPTIAYNNEMPANNILILPVNYYYSCTSNGKYLGSSTVTNTMGQWACSVDRSSDLCKNYGLKQNTTAWTDLDDCQLGSGFRYCGVDDTCGTDNCNGPCGQTCMDCNLSSGQYTCEPRRHCIHRDWWKSPYFIGGIIGLGVLMIVIVIAIIAVVHHTSKVRNSDITIGD